MGPQRGRGLLRAHGTAGRTGSQPAEGRAQGLRMPRGCPSPAAARNGILILHRRAIPVPSGRAAIHVRATPSAPLSRAWDSSGAREARGSRGVGVQARNREGCRVESAGRVIRVQGSEGSNAQGPSLLCLAARCLYPSPGRSPPARLRRLTPSSAGHAPQLSWSPQRGSWSAVAACTMARMSASVWAQGRDEAR